MKKIIAFLVVLIFAGVSFTLGFAYKYDIIYWYASTKHIKIDKSSTAQSILSFTVRCISDADKNDFSWKYRASLICNILQETKPSIICLQENKEEQYSFFKKFLKGYDSVATQRDSTSLSECLPIFYRTDLYELEQSQTFWLSDTPETMSNTWDSYYFRICTLVVLKNINTGKRFVVANTHLDYKTIETQTKSVQLIYNKLSALDLPAVVMGDFNCTPDSEAIVLANKLFVDIAQGFEDENKGTANNFEKDYNVRADFMFQLVGSFSVETFKVIDKKINNHYASDHFPLYAEIN